MPVLQDLLDLCIIYHIRKAITAKQQTISRLHRQPACIDKKIFLRPDGTRQNVFAWMISGLFTRNRAIFHQIFDKGDYVNAN